MKPQVREIVKATLKHTQRNNPRYNFSDFQSTIVLYRCLWRLGRRTHTEDWPDPVDLVDALDKHLTELLAPYRTP